MSETFPKIVVYDIEISTDLVNKPGSRDLDFDAMDISVACAFEYATGDYHVYLKDNLQDLVDLLMSADLVSGFAISTFDNPLIASQAGRLGLNFGEVVSTPPQAAFHQALDHKSFDLLVESRLGAGWKPGDRFPSGFKLDEHLGAIWGPAMKKTGDGADAPRLWREGKIGKVIDYCLGDVRRERQLFEWAWYGGLFKCYASQGHHVRRPHAALNIDFTKLPYFGGLVTDKAMTSILTN